MFVQFRALDYGLEICSFALRIPEYGSAAMEIARVRSAIDVWSLSVDDKVDLRRLPYKSSRTASTRSARLHRGTNRRSSYRVLHLSLGRIIHYCWSVHKGRAWKIVG